MPSVILPAQTNHQNTLVNPTNMYMCLKTNTRYVLDLEGNAKLIWEQVEKFKFSMCLDFSKEGYIFVKLKCKMLHVTNKMVDINKEILFYFLKKN